ncbi:hypothetical protein DUI87_24314 [Hirundo rustica rustica]|uniref:G-protein coupled receptors family 1 profile domain-containing protein n=1 Tax=Hirundo rustica rustica TaxID=333673 RepID=A0A3M0JEA0_HIRRU|nr:hypothetical protein DUI87_24314 [Hirundo rustica rustica]
MPPVLQSRADPSVSMGSAPARHSNGARSQQSSRHGDEGRALRKGKLGGTEHQSQGWEKGLVHCSAKSPLTVSLCPPSTGLHGQSEEMSNSSSISHFLLLALADTRQLQLLHFCLFLGISLAALLGNGLIISAVACGHHLHTPMFFFLLNLALTDLGSILTTVPKAMHNSLWDTRNISYTGCAAQAFFFLFFSQQSISS